MLLTGLIAACAFIFLLLKFNFRRVLQHDIAIDIGITVLLCMLFAGTFAGMMTVLSLVASSQSSYFLPKKQWVTKNLVS